MIVLQFIVAVLTFRGLRRIGVPLMPYGAFLVLAAVMMAPTAWHTATSELPEIPLGGYGVFVCVSLVVLLAAWLRFRGWRKALHRFHEPPRSSTKKRMEG